MSERRPFCILPCVADISKPDFSVALKNIKYLLIPSQDVAYLLTAKAYAVV
jgi:hypothetical protein